FAKGLGNGLAIGGVIARSEIMDCFKVNSLSTFGGNPLSTRGALATLRYLKKHDLQRNALERGRELRAGLEKIAAASKTIGEVRGKGLMQGLEFVEPGSKTPNSAVSLALLEETRARGLLIGRGGLFGNVNRIAPPLTITADEVREGLDIIEASIASIE
ncbi:MAG: aminotransferase class III-fold pyridoxal phosphate-dependent enzyme, partial [Parvularculaceae bacterium]